MEVHWTCLLELPPEDSPSSHSQGLWASCHLPGFTFLLPSVLPEESLKLRGMQRPGWNSPCISPRIDSRVSFVNLMVISHSFPTSRQWLGSLRGPLLFTPGCPFDAGRCTTMKIVWYSSVWWIVDFQSSGLRRKVLSPAQATLLSPLYLQPAMQLHKRL